MIYRLLTLIFLFSILGLDIQAQELNCNVRVQTLNLKQADPSLFTQLEADIFDFMNNRPWTTDQFEDREKIESSINITITEEVSATRFRGELIIQATRPVFNSGYKTVILKHQDNDFEFDYFAGTPLEFNENEFTSNLTSILAFYAYMIVGMDYDSFSLNGGTPYFQKASNTVNNAQNSNFLGWKAFEKTTNRYWLAENMLNNRFNKLRNSYYNYHLNGLDIMHEDVKLGRKNILKGLQDIETVQKQNPNAMAIRAFSNTKSDEIISIFKDNSVTPQEKAQITTILGKIDPKAGRRFGEIKDNQSRGGSMGNRSSTVPIKKP